MRLSREDITTQFGIINNAIKLLQQNQSDMHKAGDHTNHASGGEGRLSGIANGAINKGKPVIVESNGDFAEVNNPSITLNFTYAVGTEVKYLDASIASHDVAYDSHRKKVILATARPHLQVYVGTVTGGTTNSISWGSAQTLNTNTGDYVRVAYDPVSYQTMVMWRTGNDVQAYIVTEDGDNTVTTGPSITITNAMGQSEMQSDLINTGERKWVVVYKKSSNDHMASRVLTTSGTTISEHTETIIKTENTTRMAVSVNTEDMGSYPAYTRLVYFRAQEGASGNVRVIGATLDGNSITSVGTEYQHADTFHPNAGSAVYDPESNRFCCATRKADSDGRFITCTLDGSDNSIGNFIESVFEDGNTTAGFKVLAELGKVHICYGDRTDGTKGKIVDVTINSGTGVASYGTQNVFFDSTLQFSNYPRASNTDLGFVFDSYTNRYVVVYSPDAGASAADGFSVVGSLVGSKVTISENLLADNYIGIATKTVADDEQAEVATVGQIDDQQSGLTAGQKYYVQTDGSLATSPHASVTVLAGKAIAPTKLLILQ
tara:strand:+ start:864 stop:2501 length:1638 start_codon:yes stop_codon:yes gene_type:complete